MVLRECTLAGVLWWQEAKIFFQWDMFVMYWLCILYVVLVAAFAFRVIENWSSLPRDVGPCDLLEVVIRFLNGKGNFLSVINCVIVWKPRKQDVPWLYFFLEARKTLGSPCFLSPVSWLHALNIPRVGQQHPSPHAQVLSDWILKYCEYFMFPEFLNFRYDLYGNFIA